MSPLREQWQEVRRRASLAWARPKGMRHNATLALNPCQWRSNRLNRHWEEDNTKVSMCCRVEGGHTTLAQGIALSLATLRIARNSSCARDFEQQDRRKANKDVNPGPISEESRAARSCLQINTCTRLAGPLSESQRPGNTVQDKDTDRPHSDTV